MSNSNIYNPYSKNLEAMQGFFKKPLIFLTAIACTLYALANPILLLTYILEGETFFAMEKLIFIGIVALILLLPAASYFILFLRRKSFFKAAAVITYIYCIISFCLLTYFAKSQIGIFETVNFVVLILILIFILAIIYLIANTLVFHSIKKGLTSIYLQSKGSILLAITSLFAAFTGLAMVFAALASIFRVFESSDILIPYIGVKLSDVGFSNDLSVYLLVTGLLLFIRSVLVASFSISYRKYVRRLKTTVNIPPKSADRPYVKAKKPPKQQEAPGTKIITEDVDSYYFNTPIPPISSDENPYAAKRQKKHNEQKPDSVQNRRLEPNFEFTPHNPFDKNELQ